MSGNDERLYEVTLYWLEEKETRSEARMQLGGSALEATARAMTRLRRIHPGVDVVAITAQLTDYLRLEVALKEFLKSKA